MNTILKNFGSAVLGSIASFAAIALIAFAALACAPEAQAQVTYNLVTTSLNGGTNNVSATTTNSSFAVQMIGTKGAVMAIQPKFKLSG